MLAKKKAKFDKISLIGWIFEFFLFSKDAGDCDKTVVALNFVDTLEVVGNIVGVSEGLCGLIIWFWVISGGFSGFSGVKMVASQVIVVWAFIGTPDVVDDNIGLLEGSHIEKSGFRVILGEREDTWGSFSMVSASLVPITSCFSHFLQNKTSIEAQLLFSSSGSSSNHSSASLPARK